MPTTIEQFRASKNAITWKQAAARLKIEEDFTTAPGALVYMNCCYIENWEQPGYAHGPVNGLTGQYVLNIGRDDWYSDDLADLEQKLYDWYISECETE